MRQIGVNRHSCDTLSLPEKYGKHRNQRDERKGAEKCVQDVKEDIQIGKFLVGRSKSENFSEIGHLVVCFVFGY